ncbi:ABC transporter ATP-binding protein [Geosporobacter ferrireducens]|uniref:ABC transporter domain-containing protein n=1 Tax=Geosporobacter ferrireducens TaxID=1424294 RepID=A0A1D8GI52_9FIRM|nr:ATP-binding cassette domain-containing protein [Geosporobacter ferrireducens]AOT70570.1 hypothetical protein Gferi_13905 [Geosporobacter ferrireducens]
MIAINVEELVRRYKKKNLLKKNEEYVAVNNISFQVNKGEMFGLLGPNGAGKTTTIKILTTLLFPTEGTVNIMGLDIRKDAKKIRNQINFTFGGERGLYWRLSGMDNLKYFADLYNVPTDIANKRINRILEIIGLKEWKNERVENYSKGMKQRLHIGKALINDPEVIFLDEPTLGLDPVGAKDLREIIQNLLNLDKTILLTTHYMYEADLLCKRIAVINKGKILANDKPEALKSLVKDSNIFEVEVYDIDNDKINKIRNLEFVQNLQIDSNENSKLLQIQLKKECNISSILSIIDDNGIKAITNRRPTLEDAYIKLVGDGTSD